MAYDPFSTPSNRRCTDTEQKNLYSDVCGIQLVRVAEAGEVSPSHRNLVQIPCTVEDEINKEPVCSLRRE